MNERTLKLLEFNKIISLLAAETATKVGRQLAEQVNAKQTLSEVQKLQEETDEAVHISRMNETLPLAFVEDITGHVERCHIGGTLDPEACLQIAQLIYVGRNVKTFIESFSETVSIPHLQSLAARLHRLQFLEKAIHDTMDEHGAIYDHASTALRSIRSAIRTYESRIRERLQQLTKTKSSYLSDSIITIRNNR